MEWCRLRVFGMSGRVFGLRVRVVAAALHLCGWEGGVQKPADLNHRRMQPAQPRHEHEVVVVNLYAQFGASGVRGEGSVRGVRGEGLRDRGFRVEGSEGYVY